MKKLLKILGVIVAALAVLFVILNMSLGKIVLKSVNAAAPGLLGVPVVRPKIIETTALGAAYAAGLAVGFWSGLDELRAHWAEDQRWRPQMAEAERARLLRMWEKAVTKSLDWVDDDVT